MVYKRMGWPNNKWLDEWHTVNISIIDTGLDAFAWCKATKSNGKFYTWPVFTTWYFEYEKDALMFALKWGA